jgi:hypothetical protein
MEEERPKPESGSTDDINVEYANNAAFDFTVWDLKLIFGEYSDRAKGIEWHTSITVPWALAKLMLYFLRLNVEAYEAQVGKIIVPPSMIPAEPVAPSNPDDQAAKTLFEIIQRNRAKFLKEQI